MLSIAKNRCTDGRVRRCTDGRIAPCSTACVAVRVFPRLVLSMVTSKHGRTAYATRVIRGGARVSLMGSSDCAAVAGDSGDAYLGVREACAPGEAQHTQDACTPPLVVSCAPYESQDVSGGGAAPGDPATVLAWAVGSPPGGGPAVSIGTASKQIVGSFDSFQVEPDGPGCPLGPSYLYPAAPPGIGFAPNATACLRGWNATCSPFPDHHPWGVNIVGCVTGNERYVARSTGPSSWDAPLRRVRVLGTYQIWVWFDRVHTLISREILLAEMAAGRVHAYEQQAGPTRSWSGVGRAGNFVYSTESQGLRPWEKVDREIELSLAWASPLVVRPGVSSAMIEPGGALTVRMFSADGGIPAECWSEWPIGDVPPVVATQHAMEVA